MTDWRVKLVIIGSIVMMLLIPVGAIVLMGIASGFPIIEPLTPYLWTAVRLLVVAVVLIGGLLLTLRFLGNERCALLRKWYRESRWSAVLAQAGVFAVFAVGMVFVFGPLSFLEHIWLLLLFIGFGVMSSAARRMGDQHHCAKCNYEQTGESIAADEQEDRCPECGSFWRRPGGAIKGQRVVSKTPVVAGILLVVLAFGWNFARIGFPQLDRGLYAIIPTKLLISAVVDGRPANRTAMDVLAARELSREHDLRLMTGLLDKRAAGEGLFAEKRAWLEKAFNDGRLPPELVERFFADEVEVKIDGPAQARVGEEITLGLHVRTREMNFGTVHTMYVAFGGYVVEDEVHAKREQPIYASLFGRVRPSFRRDLGPSSVQANPEVTLTPAQPGVKHVSAVIWLYAVPHRAPATLTWNQDGTPQLPPNVLWKERVELEHEIEILP